jgi:hypothetical protein
MTADSLGAALHAALAGGERLRGVIGEIDMTVFEAGAVDGRLFERLLGALGSPLLLDHRDALALVKLFEEQGSLLSEDQRRRLVGALPDFVARVRDDIAAFLAVEVWVECGDAGGGVLDGLTRLQARVTPGRLAVLVHGWDWLCKHTTDPVVRQGALAELRRLRDHPDGLVAAEAKAALARRSASC